MVRAAFTDVSEKNFTEFFNLYKTTKVKPMTSLSLKKKYVEHALLAYVCMHFPFTLGILSPAW